MKKKKSTKYYALFTPDGKSLITYDPFRDTYSTMPKRFKELKIWDYQTFSDMETWFMGNTKKPHMSFVIKQLSSNFNPDLKHS
jgi:hypothetical protein